MRRTSQNSGPLNGVRVADFSVHAAGPFAGLMLAELGAEVIKVESAARLDITRRVHTMYGKPPSSFEQVNANKRSVCLNLKESKAVALALELVRISDIVLENFRPGVMERLGLGYAQFRGVNAGIIVVSLSSNGRTGPERSYAGYAPMFAAVGGLGNLTGYPDAPPVELRHAMDHTGGMLAAFGAVAALCGKLPMNLSDPGPTVPPGDTASPVPPFYKGGLGGISSTAQHVDVSVRDLATAFIGQALMDFAMNGREVLRQGNRDACYFPQGVYRCRGEESWVSLSVGSEDQWQGLRRAMGNPSWAGDLRFGDAYQRWLHQDELDQRLEDWTQNLSPWEISHLLQGEGVAAFPSLSAAQLAQDPHLFARDTFPTVTHPEKGSQRAVSPPWRFSHSTVKVDQWTPELGEHNMDVFHGLLGLGTEEVRALEQAKVIW